MRNKLLLDRYYLEKFILDASIATLELGGVTCNLSTHQFLVPIDAWGLPRYPDKTLILPPDADIFAALCHFIDRNAEALFAPDSWLGTWINPTTGYCHLDITEICHDFAEACVQASQRSATCTRAIVAIYNFKHKQTVYLQEEAPSH
ncbi:MAG TPA: hypothetical protein VFN35_33165 [Ktedonobacteraceae bacterium]|nr:hypothetical protein [Ktedonobacteraceae bacterium]